MRPEFVLNFFAMAPRLAHVREAHEGVLPSLLGVQLANRVKPEVYQNIKKKAQEAREFEPGRMEAEITPMSDRLKTDFRKDYHFTMDD